MTAVITLTGAGTGLGLWLVLVGLFPPPPPLHTTFNPPPTRHRHTEAGGWAARCGHPAVAWLHRLGLPTAATARDLTAVGKPAHLHLAEQATAATLGLLLPPVAAALLTAAGLRPPLTLPAAASLLLASVAFLTPDLILRNQASACRTEFRDALSSFLDLVVIALASGAGIDQALHHAADVGTSPAHTQLRHALTQARLARTPPWDTLAALGHRLAIPELQQLAATVALAGTEGATIRASLNSRAIALRHHQLAAAEAHANAATERMALPIVALFTGFLIFLGYPAVAAVLTGL
jgi:tight adherence protein C